MYVEYYYMFVYIVKCLSIDNTYFVILSCSSKFDVFFNVVFCYL